MVGPSTDDAAPGQPAPGVPPGSTPDIAQSSSFDNCTDAKQDSVEKPCSVKLALEKLPCLKSSLHCSERFSSFLIAYVIQLNLALSFSGSHYPINNSTPWLELRFGKSLTIL